MKQKPTFIRAAIMDWKYERITSGRLFEILRVPYYEGYSALLGEQEKTGKWFDISVDRIEALIMTNDFLRIKVLQDLREYERT